MGQVFSEACLETDKSPKSEEVGEDRETTGEASLVRVSTAGDPTSSLSRPSRRVDESLEPTLEALTDQSITQDNEDTSEWAGVEEMAENSQQEIALRSNSLVREDSFTGFLGVVSIHSAPSETDDFSTPGNEISYPVLSLAATDHLHASWSNTTNHDPLGLGGYQSSHLTIERPISVSRLAASQPILSFTGIGDENSVSSVIHDAARITNWQTVKDLCEERPEAACYIGRDRWTALHHACNRRCPHPDVVEALIRANPDALLLEEDKGWLPLHYACRFKAKKEIVRLLLRMYPEKGRTAVSKLDRQGRTPLYYAVRYDAPPGVVGLLLEADASAVLEEDQNADSPLALVWDAWAEKLDGKRTLQRIHVPNGEAEKMSTEEQAKYVRRRLEGQSKVLERWNKVNMFLKAAFGFPVDDESSETFESASEEKKDSPGGSDGRKWRILHAASAIKCHTSLFLLACALHPEQAMELDEGDLKGPPHVCSGWKSATSLTALHLAASSQANGDSGRVVINRLLALNSDSALALDSEGCLPLHRISGNKNKLHWIHDGLHDIYMAYVRAAQAPDVQGRLPLHHAAIAVAQHDDTSELIVARSALCNLLEVNPNASSHADIFGCLPMHYVAKHGRIWDVQVGSLHEAYPAAVRARTGVKLGNSLPLHLAASNANVEFSLINRLVELHPRGASQSSREGKLPIHIACETGLSWNSVKSIHEANPGAIRQQEQNSRGWTSLHMAAASRKSDNELISNLAQLCPEAAMQADSRSRYPLHLACIAGKTWEGGLSAIFDANPEALRCTDDAGLLPFHIVSFRYSSALGDSINLPESKKHRHSRTPSWESFQLEQTANEKEDARRIEVLFELLKADPTVLSI